MKKNKILVVALLGVMLAVGMILAGCTSDCNESVVGSSCTLSWTNGRRNSGSMVCGTSSCNVNENWNKTGSSASCNC